MYSYFLLIFMQKLSHELREFLGNHNYYNTLMIIWKSLKHETWLRVIKYLFIVYNHDRFVVEEHYLLSTCLRILRILKWSINKVSCLCYQKIRVCAHKILHSISMLASLQIQIYCSRSFGCTEFLCSFRYLLRSLLLQVIKVAVVL